MYTFKKLDHSKFSFKQFMFVIIESYWYYKVKLVSISLPNKCT